MARSKKKGIEPKAPKNVAPDKDVLQQLRDAGKTREEMAAQFGVSLSRMKRWIKQQDISPKPTKTPKVSERERTPPPMPPETSLSLMERCQQALGRRMSEDWRGYLLDGTPASTAKILRAAGLSEIRTTVSKT
jgi:hypothetical protein